MAQSVGELCGLQREISIWAVEKHLIEAIEEAAGNWRYNSTGVVWKVFQESRQLYLYGFGVGCFFVGLLEVPIEPPLEPVVVGEAAAAQFRLYETSGQERFEWVGLQLGDACGSELPAEEFLLYVNP